MPERHGSGLVPFSLTDLCFHFPVTLNCVHTEKRAVLFPNPCALVIVLAMGCAWSSLRRSTHTKDIIPGKMLHRFRVWERHIGLDGMTTWRRAVLFLAKNGWAVSHNCRPVIWKTYSSMRGVQIRDNFLRLIAFTGPMVVLHTTQARSIFLAMENLFAPSRSSSLDSSTSDEGDA